MSTESATNTASTARVEVVDEVPPDARVRDYDELSEISKRCFLSLVSNGEAALDPATTAALADGEYVRFTDYYWVDVE